MAPYIQIPWELLKIQISTIDKYWLWILWASKWDYLLTGILSNIDLTEVIVDSLKLIEDFSAYLYVWVSIPVHVDPSGSLK